MPPIHMPFCFEAAILSRMRSPVTSRSNCAKESSTFRVSRPRGVELLGHRDKGDALRIEDLDDLGEVGQRSGQPVDLVADDHVNLAGLDIGEKLLQGGALHRRAGEAAIIIGLSEAGPALVALALDVRF